MKNLLLLLLSLWLWAGSLCADEPFRRHRYDQFKALPPAEGSIVFMGNSITDMHPWGEAFRKADGTPLPIVNRGNSGTYTTEQSDNLESYFVNKPSKLFLMIGTNDIATNGLDYTAEQVVARIKGIVRHIQLRSPRTRIYLFSILNNNTPTRSPERWLRANELIKEFVEKEADERLRYIDLYEPLFGIAEGGVWSYDKLHPAAASYQLWCKAICPYLQEGEDYGVVPVYPDDAAHRQQNGGLDRSNGMRATFFSLLPVEADDVLFFGDAEVKCGEWNELLGNSHVKNRGTGWGFGGNIATTSRIVDATFAPTGVQKKKPKAILLYTGTDDVGGTAPMDSVKAHYEALVDKLARLCPEAKIYLLGLHPLKDAAKNTGRVVVFNNRLRQLAEQKTYPRLRYIDTYTPLLSSDHTASERYIRRTDYLYGLGYIKVAGLIKNALLADFPADSYTVPGEAEAEQTILQAELRCTLGQAIDKGLRVETSVEPVQFDARVMAAFRAKAEEMSVRMDSGNLTPGEVDEAVAALGALLHEALRPASGATF